MPLDGAGGLIYDHGGGWSRKEELGNPWLLCHDGGSFPKSTRAACVVPLCWLAAFVIFTAETTAGLQWRGMGGWCWEGRLLYGWQEWVFHRQLTLMSRSMLGHLLIQCLLMFKIIKIIHLYLIFVLLFGELKLAFCLSHSVKITLTIPFCVSNKWVGVFLFLHSSCLFWPQTNFLRV